MFEKDNYCTLLIHKNLILNQHFFKSSGVFSESSVTPKGCGLNIKLFNTVSSFSLKLIGLIIGK